MRSFHSVSRFWFVTLAVLFCSTFVLPVTGQETDWQKVTTVKDVLKAYPDRMKRLMEALDFSRSELQAVGRAWTNGKAVRACRKLLSYYRSRKPPAWVGTFNGDISESALEEAVDVTEGRFTFQGVTGEVPRKDHGGIKWGYRGPKNDIEWAYFLNRHQYFTQLARAWRSTGEEQFASVFDRLMRDWLIHHPDPGDGRPYWRTLEAGLRLNGQWQTAFYAFQEADAFKPATRLLMLASLPVHATYLKNNHRTGSNWVTMELNGLGHLALVFPEFDSAQDWLNHSIETLSEELNRQVYPDGVQKELTSGYHMVALKRFYKLFRDARKAGAQIPGSFGRRIESMWNYAAYSMRPDGALALNNDTDRNDVSDKLMQVAEEMERADWADKDARPTEG